MHDTARSLLNGSAQAVGQDVTSKVLQNPQCQQGLQLAASGIVASGTAVVGTVAAVGHAATVVSTAVVAGTTVVVAAAAPVAAVVAAGYGVYRFCKWLGS